MRIIADRKDYYDCIMGQGIDRSVVYVRNPDRLLLADEPAFGNKHWPFPDFRGFVGDPTIIGFCGKIYPMIRLEPRPVWPGVYTLKAIKCFDIEQVDAAMDKCLCPRDLKEYHGARRRRGYRWYRQLSRKVYEEFFAECEKDQEKHEEVFRKKRCPIFVASETSYKRHAKIEWNAMLNEHEFFRVFDPYTAFQELAMFVGNLAIEQKPMPVISDELKAGSKGFDKWSFRKMPAGS